MKLTIDSTDNRDIVTTTLHLTQPDRYEISPISVDVDPVELFTNMVENLPIEQSYLNVYLDQLERYMKRLYEEIDK